MLISFSKLSLILCSLLQFIFFFLVLKICYLFNFFLASTLATPDYDPLMHVNVYLGVKMLAGRS